MGERTLGRLLAFLPGQFPQWPDPDSSSLALAAEVSNATVIF